MIYLPSLRQEAPGRSWARPPLAIGHRGAPGYRPEHTRAGYELALAQGADVIEPDLVASRDGVLVVRHENEISTTTDVASRPEFASRRTTKQVDGRWVTGWFTEDFTWAELSTLRCIERLPQLRPGSASFDGRFPLMSFKELLSLLAEERARRGRLLRLVAEFKHPTYFRSLGLPLDELFVDEVACSAMSAPSRDWLAIECFEKGLLRDLQRRGVSAAYYYLLGAEGAAFDLVAEHGSAAPRYAEELTNCALEAMAAPLPGVGGPFDGVSVDKAVILDPAEPGHADLVTRAHRFGLDVFCWTFRPENAFLSPRYRTGPPAEFGDWRGELRELIDSAVDGIFLDHPDLARQATSALPAVRPGVRLDAVSPAP